MGLKLGQLPGYLSLRKINRAPRPPARAPTPPTPPGREGRLGAGFFHPALRDKESLARWGPDKRTACALAPGERTDPSPLGWWWGRARSHCGRTGPGLVGSRSLSEGL